MRRPHVCERSVPRAGWDSYQTPRTGPVADAPSLARMLSAVVERAATAGLSLIAQHVTTPLRQVECVAASGDREKRP